MFDRRRREAAGRRPGFSLIEAIVAMTVLSVGILGVVEGLAVCTRTASDSRRLERAAGIAERQLKLATCGCIEKVADSEGELRWTVTIESAEAGLMLATVKVKWPGLEPGEERTYELSELFRPPSQDEDGKR